MAAASVLVASEPEQAADIVLAVHGGAGIEPGLPPAEEQAIRDDLAKALKAGYARLQLPGAKSLDGVEAAVRVLEDSPYFNAGKGAVFTLEGRNELDASIMDGSNLKAGAVASLTIVKNPITAARAVMEKSPHVMLIGRGAEVFATQQGLDIVDPSYFWTEPQWKKIQARWKQEELRKASAAALKALPETAKTAHFGTVGAIALDQEGHVAAATSTGGMTGKRFGRVGDSPIIGAGTYADDASCAVSCTGHGEYFIRYAVAHDISALVKYKGLGVKDAAVEVVQKKLLPAGGEGGVIVLSPKGELGVSFNTVGMSRGWITKGGEVTVRLYDK